uniref:Ig-like domain-containing protein n=1 Tax=Loxodonta africana TaxID=9785 RepID=G3TVF7_LOXAF
LSPLVLPYFHVGVLAAKGQSCGSLSDFTLQVQGPVRVQEGLCILVPCTVFYSHKDWTYSDPAYSYWFKEGVDVNKDASGATNKQGQEVQEETQGQFFLLGNTGTCSRSLNIRNTRMHDSGSYFFQVERGNMKFTYKSNQLSVHVTALTQTPNIHILGTLEATRPKNLTCIALRACKWGTPPTFSWTGTCISSPMIPNCPVLTLTPWPQDHNLTCQLTFPEAGVTTERTVQLSMFFLYALLNVAITVFRGNGTGSTITENGLLPYVQEGQYLCLVCVISSNPPGRLSWDQGSLTLSSSLEPGVLELPKVESGDRGEFTCLDQHPLGSKHVSLSLSVQ